jgi:hypothetical protein
MLFQAIFVLIAALTSIATASTDQPWEQYILSPSFRSVPPSSVYRITGNATTSGYGSNLTLFMSPGSHISLDFGIEIAGHISFQLNSKSTQPFSLAFSESPQFVRPISDDTGAVPTENYDLTLNVTLSQPGQQLYTTPKDAFRGGFRFLTINALTTVTITNIACNIGFAPNTAELRNYSGYFYTSNSAYGILNHIWYAGAYTVQTNIAPQNTGRFLPQVKPGWDYNASLGFGGGPFLVDGAKRDRAVWPGDIGVSGTTAALALGADGLEAVRNSLESIFYYQNASTGEFPYAGVDTSSFRSGSQSDTYHAWSLISIYEYAMYSGDEAWLAGRWDNITCGIEFIVSHLDPSTGLQNQTQPSDWGRQGSGGFNSALNALDYHALVSIAALASNTSRAQSWMTAAERLKQSYSDLLWDAEAGLYRDNTTTSLHPQDGNALALLYNLTINSSQSAAISASLAKYWNSIGPVTPELPDTISPFISGLEVLAHFRAGQPTRALDLMTRLWGYLLSSPLMTSSTFVEGITANGSLYYRSTAGYNYDAAYTSLSHGWSTAPVQALMTELLGLKMTGLGGRTWILNPAVVDGLRDVRGGFETGLGRFDVAIAQVGEDFVIDVLTPEGSMGEVVVPEGWETGTVQVYGNAFDSDSCRVDGGRHRIVFRK